MRRTHRHSIRHTFAMKETRLHSFPSSFFPSSGDEGSQPAPIMWGIFGIFHYSFRGTRQKFAGASRHCAKCEHDCMRQDENGKPRTAIVPSAMVLNTEDYENCCDMATDPYLDLRGKITNLPIKETVYIETNFLDSFSQLDSIHTHQQPSAHRTSSSLPWYLISSKWFHSES